MDFDFNQSLLITINHDWGNPFFDFFFHWVSEKASFALPLAIAICGFVIWKYKANGGYLALLFITTILIGDTLGYVLKSLFALPRPCLDMHEHLRALGGGPFPACPESTSGMPSNHALNYFTCAIFLTLTTRIKPLALTLFAIAVCVGISRIYLGAHYPTQVLAGTTIGLIYGSFAAWLALKLPPIRYLPKLAR
jgi:undecaprenyl-diphosphatase